MCSRIQWNSSQVRSQVDCGNLIEIVNKLQTKLAASGNTLDVSLPQIVVVGCQSAGKSSVLENIVGREFLPRGSGVVTRRPTVVQLVPSDEEYAVFSHAPTKVFRDFKEVKREISEETLRDPGPEGFSTTPICLTIYSPKVLKLTLVDLPGLIRVIVENQSENSIEEVRNVIKKYIRQPNSLILAVSPANSDIANSDALEIAKTVDPKRTRTIGVLTKLDLMDEGTNARDILENKKIPLKRGYVGVLNRSQREIDEGKDIDYCLRKEKEFFANSPSYRHMSERMGTPYLRKLLNKQLYEHIRETLPSVRRELDQKLESVRKEMRKFMTEFGCTPKDPLSVHFYLNRLVDNFIEKFQVEIFGYSENINIHKLSTGALINYTLYRNIHTNLNLPDVPDKSKLLITIANLHGTRNTLSLPSLALETVMRQLLPQYIPPLDELIENIAEMLQLCAVTLAEELRYYPILRDQVLYLTKKAVDESSLNTKETLRKHLEAEMYFVNAYHKDFAYPESDKKKSIFPMKLWEFGSGGIPEHVGEIGRRVLSNVISEIPNSLQNSPVFVDAPEDFHSSDVKDAVEILRRNEHANENADMLMKIIQEHLKSKQEQIGDTAIKYIMFFLVKNVMNFVKTRLVPSLLESSNLDAIYQECENDFNKLADMQSTCEALEEALHAVQAF